ncbi:MAG: PEGA domain-containing protein, partial [Bradymonadaceae bacterium]
AVAEISTYPSGADVEVDGEYVGEAPVTVSDLERGGSYTVRAELSDGRTAERTVEWEQSDDVVKEIQIDFEAADEGATGEENPDESDEGGGTAERAAGSGADRGSGQPHEESEP